MGNLWYERDVQNMRNKGLFACLLALAMLLSLCSITWADEEDGSGNNTAPSATNVAKIGENNYGTLTEAIAAVSADEVIELVENVIVEEKIVINKAVTINGKGHSILYGDAYTETMFEITADGSLLLQNTVIDGGNAWTWIETGSKEKWFSDTIQVTENGKELTAETFLVKRGSLTLGAGSVVRNCVYNKSGKSYNEGCGVIKADGGTVIFDGASVNTVAGTVFVGNQTSLALRGATMISGNYGCGDKGGLFIVAGSTATMEGGASIRNNKAWVRSGVIFGVINAAEFTMNGGEITENELRKGGGNTSGPMICVETGGKFTMNGGSITNNVGKLAGAIASRWVTLNDNADNGIHLNGGTISGNTTKADSWDHAQVYVRGTLNIGENMTVEGPVEVEQEGKLNNKGTIDGKLIVNHETATVSSSGNVTEIEVRTGNVKVTGGHFESDPTEYLAEGYCLVTFDSNGGNPARRYQVVAINAKASKPDSVSKEGFHTVTWMKDGQVYDFETPVTENITLVAEWSNSTPDPEKPVRDDHPTRRYPAATGTATAGTDAKTGGSVTSAKTFDAGIALYVGMSVLSLTGSALTLGRRKEM